MLQSDLSITYLGEAAWKMISQERGGRVWGITSRGAFLHFPPNKILFLSFELERGPLTLNLQGNPGDIQNLAPGALVDLRPGFLSFPSSNIRIDLRSGAVWRPPPPAGTHLHFSQIRQNLASVAGQILSQGRTSEGSVLLFHMLDIPREGDAPVGLGSHMAEVHQLGEVLRANQTDRVLSILERLLGSGTGLTPGGDDLAVGLLLTLNRWGKALAPGITLQPLNRAVVRLAYQKTTTLSANLIECAAEGQADERLIFALDGIVTGKPDSGECASRLLSWGNSSGGDSLAGMTLALTC